MPETTHLLETALENEAKLLLKMINELQNDDLYVFCCRLAELNPGAGREASDEILNIAQNIKHISTALEDFYVA